MLSFDLLRCRVPCPLPGLDSHEEDVKEPGTHSFSHSHMRKAFRLMNDLRKSVNNV